MNEELFSRLTKRQQKFLHNLDSHGNPTSPDDYAICEFIKEHAHLFVLGSEPYIYRGGAYFRDEKGKQVQHWIKCCLFQQYRRQNTITRIYSQLVNDISLHRTYADLNNFPTDWICFKNKMYSTSEKKTYDHKPEYLCLNQIPHEFDPDDKTEKKGKVTKAYFEKCMSKDDRETVLQYLGLCMTRINVQKFPVLLGGRGTGKSVLIHLFEYILGTENVSAVALQRLEDQFHSILLLGKLLNACADIPASPLKTSNTIKLITGGDTITDSYKGRDNISFTPYARLMFSCNSIPPSYDEKSNAFFERLVIIEMQNRPEKPNRRLIEDLQEEAPFIIRNAVKALERLMQSGNLSESKRSRELVEQAYADSDSVQAFIRDKLERDPDAKTEKKKLHEAYENYCKEEEREGLSRNKFYQALRTKGFVESPVNGIYCFNGLSLEKKSEKTAENDQKTDEFHALEDRESTPFDGTITPAV